MESTYRHSRSLLSFTDAEGILYVFLSMSNLFNSKLYLIRWYCLYICVAMLHRASATAQHRSLVDETRVSSQTLSWPSTLSGADNFELSQNQHAALLVGHHATQDAAAIASRVRHIGWHKLKIFSLFFSLASLFLCIFRSLSFSQVGHSVPGASSGSIEKKLLFVSRISVLIIAHVAL